MKMFNVSPILALSITVSTLSPFFATNAAAARDRTAPTTPTGLTATASSSSVINLSWTASTDNVGVKGYKIYRSTGSNTSTTQITTTTGTRYSDTGLLAAKRYNYQVAAYDAANNVSKKSNLAATATTDVPVTSSCAPFPTGLSCAAPPTATLCVNVKDKGAIGNGTANDTSAIQAAIDATAVSGGRVYIPAGTYMVDALTRLKLRSNVTLDMSSGAILKAIPNNQTNFSVIRGNGISNSQVIGGTIQGERAQHIGNTGEWGHGIELYNSQAVVIENTTSKDHWGDGFYVGSTSKNITACSITADGNRRQGMSVTSANGLKINNSTFKNTAGTAPEAGIDLEPNSGETVTQVTIQNSTIENNRGAGVSSDASSTDGSMSSFITINKNTITGNSANGDAAVRMSYATSHTVTNNIISNNLSQGMYMEDNSNSNGISGNTIENNGGYGIEMYQVKNNTITSNTIQNNGRAAMIIDTASGNSITNNTGNGGIINNTPTGSNTLLNNAL